MGCTGSNDIFPVEGVLGIPIIAILPFGVSYAAGFEYCSRVIIYIRYFDIQCAFLGIASIFRRGGNNDFISIVKNTHTHETVFIYRCYSRLVAGPSNILISGISRHNGCV